MELRVEIHDRRNHFFALELFSVVRKGLAGECWCILQSLVTFVPFVMSYQCFCSRNRRAVDLSSGNP